ncbi:MAG: hypothetical protein JXR65_07215 [Bacteroidales bacterium]|nr:hypothetical protein [Bacteroidales bacterium]
MNKNKVVFLPGYYHLSLPLFFKLVKRIQDSDIQDVFFHTDDPILYEVNKKYTQFTQICDVFSEVVAIENSDLTVLKNYFKYNRLKQLFNFYSFIKQLHEIRNRLDRKLNEISPNLILSTGGNTINIMCNSWARKHNIPFVILQPSFLEFKKQSVFFIIKNKILNLVFSIILGSPINVESRLFGDGSLGNYLFVWSEHTKQRYSDTRLKNRTFVTGNPLHNLYQANYNDKVNWEKIGCKPIINKKIVTICPQTLDRFSHIISKKDADEINNIYFHLIDNHPELFFIVKTHPIQNEDYDFYKEFLSRITHDNYFISQEADLNSVYQISDLQISFSSTTSFDAVIQNVPIVLIKPHLLQISDYFNGTIELTASNYSEANKMVEYGLTEEYKEVFKLKRERYLKMHGLFDSKSTERVVNKIQEILDNCI